jgi:uncharacterized membrane protein
MTNAVATAEGATPTPAQAERIQAFDVTRGGAMLAVFLSHFSLRYLRVVGPHVHAIQHWLTQIATPAFMLVSGMMLGLLRIARGDFSRIREKLIDRGLFLLIVARPLIALGHLALVGTWRLTFIDQVFITDAVGVSLILGAILAKWIGEWGRVRLGILVLLVSWFLDVWWTPGTLAAQIIKEFLFGRLLGEALLYNFPLLPWFGWYLVGSGVGTFVARAHAERGARAAARVAFRFAALGAAIAVVAKIASQLLKLAHPHGLATTAGRMVSMLSVKQKIPPGITYLFFYGAIAGLGVGLALVWGDRVRTSSRPSQATWRWLAMMGRNSLLAFVLQFYVYYTAVYLLPKPPLWFAPAYFAITVVLLSGMLAVCDRLRLNQYFTIGFAPLARRRRERRVALGLAPPFPALSGVPSRDQPASSSVAERR